MTHPMDELLAYVAFGDEDARHLTAARAAVEGDFAAATREFYDAIDDNPGAAAVLRDEQQRARLERSMHTWLHELFTGPYDAAYHDHRLRIGRTHVRVGLANQYMFTAMNVLRRALSASVRQRVAVADHGATLDALHKILDVELAIMLGTYMEERQRAAIERFRDVIISTLPVCVMLLDADNRVLASAGPKPYLLSHKDPTGMVAEEALSEGFVKATTLPRLLGDARVTGQTQVLPLVTLPGALTRSLRVTVVPVEHASADVLVHIEDLTDVVEAETKMRQSQNLAQLGEMAAAIAHEIRNPLAGISSTIQVIADGLDEGDRRRAILGKVQEQVYRLGTQVGDLLSFARPVTARPGPVVLSNVCARLEAEAQLEDDQTLVVSGDGQAYADDGLLAQVLTNLVQNALQAGARRVEVRLADGHIEVEDDAGGIPLELQQRIFQPFFTTKTRGTGLGLAVSARFLETMGGRLSLGRSDETGTRFDLDLKVNAQSPEKTPLLG